MSLVLQSFPTPITFAWAVTRDVSKRFYYSDRSALVSRVIWRDISDVIFTRHVTRLYVNDVASAREKTVSFEDFQSARPLVVPRMYCNRGKCIPEYAAVRPLSARAFYIELFRIFPRYRSCLRHGLELPIPNRSAAPGGNLGEIERRWRLSSALLRVYIDGDTKKERERKRKRGKKSQVVSIFLRSLLKAKVYFFTPRELYFAQEKDREARLNSRCNIKR